MVKTIQAFTDDWWYCSCIQFISSWILVGSISREGSYVWTKCFPSILYSISSSGIVAKYVLFNNTYEGPITGLLNDDFYVPCIFSIIDILLSKVGLILPNHLTSGISR